MSTSSAPTELPSGIDYFFALRPDDQARTAIAAIAARLRKGQRCSGASVPAESLHLLLCPLGRTQLLRHPLERALLSAGNDVKATTFVASLDTARRCRDKDGQFPFALCADRATTDAALALRTAIAEAQRRLGLHVAGVSSFDPHVALQFGPAIDAIEQAIPPVRWPVGEFVLLRSCFGHYRHEVIGCWPLASQPAHEAMDMLAELADLPDLPASLLDD